jgi:putative tryptophan/tyrosine transport system substrate-binding protein
MLINPTSAQYDIQLHDVQIAARQVGKEVIALNASTDAEIEHALWRSLERPDGALLVSSDPFFQIRRERIISFAARHRVPTIYPWREYVEAGGLASYGPSLFQAYRQAGSYAARILKGEKAAELPVQQPTKFELVVNLKSWKALGLAFRRPSSPAPTR